MWCNTEVTKVVCNKYFVEILNQIYLLHMLSYSDITRFISHAIRKVEKLKYSRYQTIWEILSKNFKLFRYFDKI